jgi:hypothetical protein
MVVEAYLDVLKTDTYTLDLYLDDGSKLYLNDQLLVERDGSQITKYVWYSAIFKKEETKVVLTPLRE